MKFAFLPTIDDGPAIWSAPPPNILAFPMAGAFVDPVPAGTGLTFYPRKMTLDKAVEYWWRVKSWRLTYAIADISGFIIAERGIEQDDEEELCRPTNYEWQASEDLGAGNSISVNIRFLTDAADPRYSMSHTEVLPALEVEIFAQYFSGDSDITLITSSAPHPLTGSISFDGEALECSYADETGEPFTFTIVPEEYYSWSGTWSTTSGAKI